ncbi:MAGUK p55 subfamily member 7 isoform X5 [Onthophagus taurus]|nr:MAGUK p55 subfamily member 7 isoform X5 [Onthophagus taurus]
MNVMYDVLQVIASRTSLSEDCKELFYLFQKPHVQGLLYAHDAVAQKDYYPHLPEIPLEVDEDEETVKIVQLVKSNEPLGATIKTDEKTAKIVIARVMHGGAADRSGLIHVGDEVVEVNGINVEGKTPGDVLTILQNSEGTITFKLVPANGKSSARESKVRVRAHFDYYSSSDPYIPCKEAGLDFVKGDVLHIVSQDDGYWWQARKEGDRNMRAGLIPSRALQERRISLERTLDKDKENAENDDFDREHIATYEEVAKLYPRPGIYRPIVLIGAPGVGRNELKRRLIDIDPIKYKTPIPFTSRPMKPGEVNGKDYFFVTREQMEAEIEENKFIEYGEYKGNLYGTSADSVKGIVGLGNVCILNPHYQALKMLRTPQLRPYIIYIKPPPLDVLKQTREAMHAKSTFDVNSARGFTDEEFTDIIKSSSRIEYLYDHFFDEQIVNADLALAFGQLLASANRLETEPLWVPASWVQ